MRHLWGVKIDLIISSVGRLGSFGLLFGNFGGSRFAHRRLDGLWFQSIWDNWLNPRRREWWHGNTNRFLGSLGFLLLLFLGFSDGFFPLGSSNLRGEGHRVSDQAKTIIGVEAGLTSGFWFRRARMVARSAPTMPLWALIDFFDLFLATSSVIP